jgi:hypothetical protein
VGDQVWHRWCEEGIQVNHDSSEEDTKVVASVKTKNQRPPVKTKKKTMPKNKPTSKPRMV